jgi:hypothetical protein
MICSILVGSFDVLLLVHLFSFNGKLNWHLGQGVSRLFRGNPQSGHIANGDFMFSLNLAQAFCRALIFAMPNWVVPDGVILQ